VSGEIDPNWPPPAYELSDEVDQSPPPPERLSRRTSWLVAALVGFLTIGAVALVTFGGINRSRPHAYPGPTTTTASTPPATASTTAGPTAGPCGPDETSSVRAALARTPPDTKTGRQWSSAPQDSNYNPCAELSAVVVTVQDATGSSPDTALMFHRGEFVGTATPKAYPFTKLLVSASTDDIVVLTYRTDQSCDSCDDGTLTTVGFQWQGDHVLMLDSPPDLVDAPPP
jgi:hypothetical protein